MKLLLIASCLFATGLTFAQVDGSEGPGNNFTYKVITCEMRFDVKLEGKEYKNVTCLSPKADPSIAQKGCDQAPQKMSFELLDGVLGKACHSENNVNITTAWPTTNPLKKYDGAAVSLLVNGNSSGGKLQLLSGRILSLPKGAHGATSTPIIGTDLITEVSFKSNQPFSFSSELDVKYALERGAFNNRKMAHLSRVNVNCYPGVDSSKNVSKDYSFYGDIGAEVDLCTETSSMKLRRSIALDVCEASIEKLNSARKDKKTHAQMTR